MAGRHPQAYMDILAATRKNESPYKPDLCLAGFQNKKTPDEIHQAF